MTAAAASAGAPQELALDEQIAAYQREFPEVDPQTEKVVTALGRQPGLDWRCGWRLGSLLREQRVEVLNAHQYTPFFYALMARLVALSPQAHEEGRAA